MPIYTYMCDDCGLTTDLIKKMCDRGDDTKCCCGGPLLRILNFTGGVFIR